MVAQGRVSRIRSERRRTILVALFTVERRATGERLNGARDMPKAKLQGAAEVLADFFA